jgi:two-component system response regulator WspF
MRIAVVNNLVPQDLCRIILTIPDYEIAWVAHDGAEAVKKCASDRPDLILIDPDLPRMDGVEATCRIMEEFPCPILIVTTKVEDNAAKVFKAIGCGALDAVNTPLRGDDEQAQRSREVFLKKINTIVKLQGAPSKKVAPKTESKAEALRRKTESFREQAETFRRKTESFRMFLSEQIPPLVIVGSSTGGPKTLVKVLSRLPENLEVAVVIVQHLDKEFTSGLADWLNAQTSLKVRVATRGAYPEKGIVDVAGTNDHLILTAGLRFAYTPEPRNNPYRPSVDVFFKSVAKHWPNKGCAILLTGMGRDGATELANLRNIGWYTIAQDQATSVVYGMPKAAKELNAATEILSLEKIGSAILHFASSMNKKREK